MEVRQQTGFETQPAAFSPLRDGIRPLEESVFASPAVRRQSAHATPAAHPISPSPTLECSGDAEEATSCPGPSQATSQQAAAAPSDQQALAAEHSGASSIPPPGPTASSSGEERVERVVLNLWVNESTDHLQVELAGMRAAVAALQQQLEEAQSGAQRVEAAREAGALRAVVARLEGAVQAGQAKIRSQAAEIEGLRAANEALERQAAALQAQSGELEALRSAASEQENLSANLVAARSEAEAAQRKAARLAAVVAHDSRERVALAEFTALEHGVLKEEEAALQAKVQAAEEAAAAAAADLAAAAERATAAQAALVQREAELHAARDEAARAASAAAAAEKQAAEWQARAAEYDRDRQQAASNLRKAEREVDLIAKENETLFRQVNYVGSRLVAQLGLLEGAAPDIAKLARELSAWTAREQVQRVRTGGAAARA